MRGIHRSPTQRPVTRSFDVFFDLRLNKRLSKQSWGWWFETLLRSSWCHRNVLTVCSVQCLHIYRDSGAILTILNVMFRLRTKRTPFLRETHQLPMDSPTKDQHCGKCFYVMTPLWITESIWNQVWGALHHVNVINQYVQCQSFPRWWVSHVRASHLTWKCPSPIPWRPVSPTVISSWRALASRRNSTSPSSEWRHRKQMTFLNEFSSMNFFGFQMQFHWNMFLMV